MVSVIGAIRDHWLALGGAQSFLGEAMIDETTTPDGIGRFNHFQGGSIYWTPSTGAHEVHGAIREKWASLGYELSFLGYPISDETDLLGTDGKVSVFERGSIYWWPDTEAIELNDVVVHYTGLVCFGEMDWDQSSNSDEPYVVLGVVSPTGSTSFRSQIYEDVDGGESRPDLLEIYRGKPHGLTISVVLMEHDEDNPDKYKVAMEAGVGAAFTAITGGIAVIPVVGPVIAAVVGPLLGTVTSEVANAINSVFDFADDRISQATIGIDIKQMVILAARTANSEERGVGFKLVTPLLSGGGASYKVYFGLVPA